MRSDRGEWWSHNIILSVLPQGKTPKLLAQDFPRVWLLWRQETSTVKVCVRTSNVRASSLSHTASWHREAPLRDFRSKVLATAAPSRFESQVDNLPVPLSTCKPAWSSLWKSTFASLTQWGTRLPRTGRTTVAHWSLSALGIQMIWPYLVLSVCALFASLPKVNNLLIKFNSTNLAGMLGERGLGLVVHIPSGYVAKIIIAWPWPWPWPESFRSSSMCFRPKKCLILSPPSPPRRQNTPPGVWSSWNTSMGNAMMQQALRQASCARPDGHGHGVFICSVIARMKVSSRRTQPRGLAQAEGRKRERPVPFVKLHWDTGWERVGIFL